MQNLLRSHAEFSEKLCRIAQKNLAEFFEIVMQFLHCYAEILQ